MAITLKKANALWLKLSEVSLLYNNWIQFILWFSCLDTKHLISLWLHLLQKMYPLGWYSFHSHFSNTGLLKDSKSLKLFVKYLQLYRKSSATPQFFQKQPPEVFYRKKVFLKFLQKSQENTCARVSFLIKLQASGLQLY